MRLVWTTEARFCRPSATTTSSTDRLALPASAPAPWRCSRDRVRLRPVDELLAALASSAHRPGRARQTVVDELRTVINWLLGTGALQLVTTSVAEVVAA